MKHQVTTVLACAALAAPALAQNPPGEAPALGTNRITMSDITGGSLSLQQIRRRGMEIFSTPFNKLDGYGDGPFDTFDPDATSPGHRPTLGNNGTFLRMNGLDSQTCLECHNVESTLTIPARLGIGGMGGIAATALPEVRYIDIDDEDDHGFATFDGRIINPPFVFGAGGVELLAKEMTAELQGLKASAQSTPDVPVALVTKGVDFGTIVFDSQLGDFDVSGVEGIDDNLVVQPFGRKGNNQSVREFDLGAFQFHQGMQPSEIVGAGVDADNDGVADELIPGEISAVHIFGVTLERPLAQRGGPDEAMGRSTFLSIGCADCHVPRLFTDSRFLPMSFPEVDTDPYANVFMQIDLSQEPPAFRPVGNGLAVDLFSDLKRHDMGPDLAEMTGHELDPFFVTPRLWGIADSGPYLHDGRALTLTEAILAHGGEGAASAADFSALSDTDKANLLKFLRTLRTPRNAAEDILAMPPSSGLGSATNVPF